MEFSKIIDYILSRLNSTTAWLGIIGLVLYAFGMHTTLIVLFASMFFLSESNFSEIFKGWTAWLRSIVADKDGTKE